MHLTEEELNQKIFEEQENFSLWQYQMIAPFIKGDVIEIGPGNGRITRQAYDHPLVTSVTGVDTNRRYIKKISHVFKDFTKKPMKFSFLDLQKPFPKPFQEAFDTVISIDVLEHVKDDVMIVRNARKLLRPGGKIVLLVPALKFLYGEPDRAQNHYRRFSRASIKQKLRAGGFTIETIFSMNFIGIFAWFYHSKVLKLRVHRARDMKMFDKLVPFFRFFERMVPIPLGLSYIVVGKKE